MMQKDVDTYLYTVMQSTEHIVSEEPFRHVVADNFFTEEFYQSLVDQYEAVLGKGISPVDIQGTFSRFIEYDAYGVTAEPGEDKPTSIMRTKAWKAYWEKMFGMKFSDDEIMNFHLHLPGGKDGWIHTDEMENIVVEGVRAPGMLNSWYHNSPYNDTKLPDIVGAKKVTKALTFIYYLANTKDLVGGETILYDQNQQEVKRIEPKNNRMLVFEINDISYHAYANNPSGYRKTITQWLHKDIAQT